MPSMVTVFIDGFFDEPASVTRLLGLKVEQHEGVSQKNSRICQVWLFIVFVACFRLCSVIVLSFPFTLYFLSFFTHNYLSLFMVLFFCKFVKILQVCTRLVSYNNDFINSFSHPHS